MKMKYYRVECLWYPNGKRYAVQTRKWGFWCDLREYTNSTDAFIHLDSLNRFVTMQRERADQRIADQINEFIAKLREVFNR